MTELRDRVLALARGGLDAIEAEGEASGAREVHVDEGVPFLEQLASAVCETLACKHFCVEHHRGIVVGAHGQDPADDLLSEFACFEVGWLASVGVDEDGAFAEVGHVHITTAPAWV